MSSQVKSNPDYYQYLDVVQKACGKLRSIQKDKFQIIYANLSIEICKDRLEKEIERLDEKLRHQREDLSI